MIPSIIFSIAYLYLLNNPCDYTLIGKIYAIIFKGVGHLWFLPMLFMCFISTWVIEKLRISPRAVIIVLALMVAIHISKETRIVCIRPYYILFFYIGYCLKAYKIKVMPYATRKNIAVLTTLTVLLFIFAHGDFAQYINGGEMLKHNIGRVAAAAERVYALPGVAAFYLYSMRRVYIHNKTLPMSLQNLVGTCFGVYLFQEFILKWLYYHTAMPDICSPYTLPWVGIAITLPMSILLTMAVLKTKAGRWLMG
jgi:hypothetical protein